MSDIVERINWDEVKSRLHESERAMDRALAGDEEQLAAIYRERAAQLAGRRVGINGPSTALRVLVFSLGSERYALEVAALAELLPFVNCTPVPGGPAQLLGVINVHGEIRSVVDLGDLLELPDRERREGGYVLLLRNQGREVALRVDQIDNIRMVTPEQLSAPDAGEGGTSLRYVKGWTRDRLRLLHTEAILANPIYQKMDEE